MHENVKKEIKWKILRMKVCEKKSCPFLTQKETTFRMTDKYPFSDVKVAQIADKGKESV